MQNNGDTFVAKKGQRFAKGKYKNRLVSDIIITDNDYVKWVLNNNPNIISHDDNKTKSNINDMSNN